MSGAMSLGTAGLRAAELGRERREHLTRQRRHLAHQNLEHPISERAQCERRRRPDRDSTRRRVEQREFAEMRAGSELADSAAPAQHGSVALEHDEEHLAVFTFAHDVGSFVGLDHHEVAGHDAQVADCAASEERNGSESFDGGGP